MTTTTTRETTTILLACGSCGHTAPVPARFAGGKVKCKSCAEVLRVPGGTRAEAEPAARCEECGQGLRAGLERCGGCGPRPTPLRLLLRSLVFVALGLPLAVVGGVGAFAASKLMGVAVVAVWLGFALGVVATLAGGLDLVQALLSLATGDRIARPVATRWLLEQLHAE